MSEAIRIRDLLVREAFERLAEPAEPVVFTGIQATDTLLNDLEGHPHAFVIACLMDRQTKAEKAWTVPYELGKRIGTHDIAKWAELSLEDLSRAMKEPTPLHWMHDEMGETIHEAIARIMSAYEGDASLIWRDRPPSAAIVRRFLEFRGAGPKIATMAANILVRDFGIEVSDRYSIDISVDTHVRRVFTRLGLVSPEASDEIIIYRARELHPEYPGIFDLAFWELGRSVCRPDAPACATCYLSRWCAACKESGMEPSQNATTSAPERTPAATSEKDKSPTQQQRHSPPDDLPPIAKRRDVETYDGTSQRQFDDGDSFVCGLWFEEKPEKTRAAMRYDFARVARRIRPLAKIDFDGVYCRIEGRGHDRRCSFCRYLRKALGSSHQVEVLKSECPFEENYGDLRPEKGEEFVGKCLRLHCIDSGETVVKTVGRKPDPTIGVISFKSPIVQSLVKAGGLRAKPGCVVVIRGEPMYRLLSMG